MAQGKVYRFERRPARQGSMTQGNVYRFEQVATVFYIGMGRFRGWNTFLLEQLLIDLAWHSFLDGRVGEGGEPAIRSLAQNDFVRHRVAPCIRGLR